MGEPKECLKTDSEEVNTATCQDVACALAARWPLNDRMIAALDRDFVNKHREREIPRLEPHEYDIIIRTLLMKHRWSLDGV